VTLGDQAAELLGGTNHTAVVVAVPSHGGGLFESEDGSAGNGGSASSGDGDLNGRSELVGAKRGVAGLSGSTGQWVAATGDASSAHARRQRCFSSEAITFDELWREEVCDWEPIDFSAIEQKRRRLALVPELQVPFSERSDSTAVHVV
jgi:hypothetical protein